MQLGLEGKVALIAAGSRGIGRATALSLSREGASVAICARGEQDLHKTVAECEGPSLGVQADVRNSSEVKDFVTETNETFGKIDILVNNAGGPPPGGFENMSLEDFEEAIELNLMSTVRLTKEVLPHIKKQPWGRIITITSVSVKEPLENLVLSNMARSGATSALKTLAGEIADEQITVNTVLPGMTWTDRMRQLTEDRAEREEISLEQAKQETVEEVPMKRWGEPEEIADVITFLASNRASFVTGTQVQVDGGFIRGLL